MTVNHGGIIMPPQQAQNISVVAKDGVTLELLKASAMISTVRGTLLQTAAGLNALRGQVVSSQEMMKKVSLMGNPIDRDVIAGEKEAEQLTVALRFFADFIERLGEAATLPAFQLPRPDGETEGH